MPVPIFGGGSGGFGWAIKPFPEADTYHWAINWDCGRGSGAPILAPVKLAMPAGANSRVAAAFEWATVAGDPLVLLASGGQTAQQRIIRLQDNALTVVSTIAGDTYTSAVLYRYDQDATIDPHEEMAWFAGTGENLVRRKKDGTTDQAGGGVAHTAQADVLAVVGADLYLSRGYRVQKLNLNTNPGLSANYGTLFECGLPSYAINAILPFGNSPMVAKGDGLFRFNQATDPQRFDNLLPTLSPHPDNGKGAFYDGRGRVYFPTFDGDVLVVTFGAVSQQRPTRLTKIDRDTPFGPISAFQADGERVYAATKPGHFASSQVPGFYVQSDDGGVFTNHTANVSDGRYDTLADWTLLAGTADSIYVGATEPFLAVKFLLQSVRTGDVARSGIQYSTGVGTWATAASRDGTIGFARSGVVVIANSTWGDLPNLAASPWVQSAVNGVTRYWVRISPADSIAGVKCREVALVPYRPPLDATLFPISAYVLAGALPQILTGEWQGQDLLWHHLATIEGIEVDQLLISRVAITGIETQRSLLAISADEVTAIPVGPDAQPQRAIWPKLADYGEAGDASSAHLIVFSGQDFGLPDHIKQVDGEVVIRLPWLQSDDEARFYYYWDEGIVVHREDRLSDPIIVLHGLRDSGAVLYSAIAFSDGSRDAIGPRLLDINVADRAIPGKREVEAGWQDLGPVARRYDDIKSPQGR